MLGFTLTIDVSSADDADKDAAVLIVKNENVRRAAADPPEDALPLSPAGALLASYKTTMENQVVPRVHDGYIKQAKAVLNAQRKAAYEASSPTVQDQIDTLLGL